MIYTIYELGGRIIRKVTCHESQAAYQLRLGEFMLQVDSNDELEYINDGQLTPRLAMPCSLDKLTVISDGLDCVALAGVPIGAEVFSDGILLGIADGSDVEVEYDLPGTYPLKIRLFPYLDFEEVIDAS